MHEYTLILEPDLEEGGYVVTVPALPGFVTQGDTYEEAIAMAKDAIAGDIESLKLAGEPIPEVTVPPQIAKVRVAAWP